MFCRLVQHSALLVLVVSTAVAAPVLADDRVMETPIFRLELPLGWKTEGQGTPLRARGPNSEVLLISVAIPDPRDTNAGRMADTRQMASFWKEGIRRSLVGAISQPGMKQTEPFTERVSQGLALFTAKSQDEQRGSFLSCYGLIGHAGAVFIITVEGWLKNKPTAEVAVEEMIKTIVWKRQT
jgi:hypothetical protein